EGVQVAAGEAEAARGGQAPVHHRRAGAKAPRLGQEVHLAQLAGVGRAIRQWGDAAAAGHRAAALEDEVRTAWLRVSPGHPVDFRIVDRETVAAGAELGHYRADDGGHAGIVPGLDRADCPVSAGDAVSGTMVARARCSANAAARRPGA